VTDYAASARELLQMMHEAGYDLHGVGQSMAQDMAAATGMDAELLFETMCRIEEAE